MPREPTDAPRLTIKLSSSDEKARWVANAEACYQDLTAFVRQAVNERCEREERARKKKRGT